MEFLRLFSLLTAVYCQFCTQDFNGKQSRKASICSETQQGVIPDVSKMVSTIIKTQKSINTKNTFNTRISTKSLLSGFKSDLENKFLSEPQSIDSQSGFIKGFMQLTIQPILSNTAPDPKNVVFFQELNDKSPQNGNAEFIVQIPAGTIKTKGLHRICTMAAAAAGQPVLMPVAQRGAQDDCVRVNFE